MPKTCCLCSGPINGHSTDVYFEPMGGGRRTIKPAHLSCARMLDDDEPEPPEDDEPDVFVPVRMLEDEDDDGR